MFFEKKYPEIMDSTGKNWDPKDEKLKERVLDKLTDKFHPIFEESLESVNRTLGKVEQRRENFNYLFFGYSYGC